LCAEQKQNYPEGSDPARGPTTTQQRRCRVHGGTPDPFARHHHHGMIDVVAAHSDDEQNQDTHHMHGQASLVDKVLHGAAGNGRSWMGMPSPWGESGAVEPAAAQYIAAGEQQPSAGRCLVPADKRVKGRSESIRLCPIQITKWSPLQAQVENRLNKKRQKNHAILASNQERG
jgi:hypothetical protein